MSNGMMIVKEVEMVALECANCRMMFAITRPFQNLCRETGQGFCCPQGHSNVYRKTELDRKQEEIDRMKRTLEWEKQRLENERARSASIERQRRAMKGKLTKAMKRIGKGVCPCCNRTFQNLQQHMVKQHPEYADGPKECEACHE